MGWFSRARKQYQDLVARYGKIAVITYFTIFFSALFGFWAAVSSGADLTGSLGSLGLDGSSASGRSGTFVVAYGFTKLTQPLRIALTLVVTPLIARFFGHSDPAEAAAEAAAEPVVGPAPALTEGES